MGHSIEACNRNQKLKGQLKEKQCTAFTKQTEMNQKEVGKKNTMSASLEPTGTNNQGNALGLD